VPICSYFTTPNNCTDNAECSWDTSSQVCRDAVTTSSNWVSHTWNFNDGTESSFILNRTDQEYLDYIISIEALCTSISKSSFVWFSDAGNDANWQEFGIPDCTGSSVVNNSFDIDSKNTHPHWGDVGIGTDATIHVEFTKEISEEINYSDYFSLIVLDSGITIEGAFKINEKGFDFTPYSPLASGTQYRYSVARNMVDAMGTVLGYKFYSNFSTGSGTTGDVATVKGRVKGPSGNPVKDAFVEVHTSDWSISRGSPTDQNGDYIIFNIEAGSYFIDVYPPSNISGLMKPPSQELELKPGETLKKDFSFTQAVKTITGKVLYSDGSPVGDARVGAFQLNTNNWADTETDTTGSYTLTVSGGSWNMNISPSTSEAEWVYTGKERSISFATDTTIEERIINFSVTATNAAIIGKVVLPDLSVPSTEMFSVRLRDAEDLELHSSLDKGGSFYIPVTAGTYTIFIDAYKQPYQSPELTPVTVANGETLDVGTIQLLAKNDHISGLVLDEGGLGIKDVEVNAWQVEGSDYTTTKTDASGAYDLSVTPGQWEVNTYAEPLLNVYNPDPPKRVTVESGIRASVTFTLLPADASITGTVIDSEGNVLSNLYAWVNLSPSIDAFDSGIGAPIDRGKFILNAPAGTYSLNVFMPSGSLYSAGDAQIVTLISGATISVDVVVKENTSEITGTMKDELGAPVTGFDADVFVTSGSGTWQEATFNKATGKYSIKVAAGTWYIGYDIDPASGFISLHEPTGKIILGDGEIKIHDVLVQRAGAIIRGRVTDPTGAGVSYAFVTTLSSLLTIELSSVFHVATVSSQKLITKLSSIAPSSATLFSSYGRVMVISVLNVETS